MAILRAFLQILQVLEWATSSEGMWLTSLGSLYLLWWPASSVNSTLASYSLIALGLMLWFGQQKPEY
ncbi:MAG: hypothetical protein ICV62_15950 [Cyanobacteria bacterium Co-bin13]|nr:hypothetical protein [Cyanobacteria bacterium Co-bin13]